MGEISEQDAAADAMRPMPPVALLPESELRLAAGRSQVLADLRRYVAGLDGHGEPGGTVIPRWAEACGLVHVVDGVHVPVEKNAKLLDDPLDLWERAYSAIGQVGVGIAAEDDAVPPFFATLFPQWVSGVAFTLYEAGDHPIPVELLYGVLTTMFGLEPAQDDSTRHATAVTLDLLERFGAIERTTTTDSALLARVAEIAGTPNPSAAMVKLTPIAVWAINRELRAAGVDAPIIGEGAGEELGELCRRLLGAAPEVVDGELKVWVRHRSPSDATTEASDFLRVATLPSERLFALIALGETGESGIAAAAEVRADGGLPGAVAAMWLSERGAVGPETVTREEVVIGMTDHFAAMHAHGAFVHQLAEMDGGFELVDVLTASDHPARLDLLDAVAAEHPDRQVARKARKARFKLRSSGL
ncbi:hypothetical protein [Amycolatopsis pittospori]|uniref:hypothetical protein n=1 Tax=Amycolatopsis pittospori TaxID=2749434 RepID=UPI001F2C8AEC|nr:hypothetical protein [Amycolatopsis pittospori]